MLSYLKLKSIFFSIGLLLLSTAFLISGIGLMNTLVSLKFKMAGKSLVLIGYISAMYFSGMIIGSLKISKLIKTIGYSQSFITLSSVMAITVIFPIINDNMIIFSTCRFIQGICISGLYIIIESWILSSSSKKNRGKTLAIYMTVLYGSYSIGQFFLSKATVNTIVPFCISTILIVLSIIPLSGFSVTPPLFEEHKGTSLRKVFSASQSGFLGCLVSGIFISAIFSILPLYIEDITNNTHRIILALVLTFMSGVVVQYPLGVMSDKFDRHKIQIILNTVFSIFLALFAILEYHKLVNYYILLFIVVIIGTFSFTIYPISMNLVCDNLKKSQIIQGMEALTIAFGIGSILGPLYTSVCIKFFGFYAYSASYLLLTIFLIVYTTLCVSTDKYKKHY